MKKSDVYDKLARRQMTADEMGEAVLSDLRLLPAVIDGVASDNKRVKNACGKILRTVSEVHPDKLYGHFPMFVEHMDGDDTILKWLAMDVIGNFAAVDTKDQVDKLLKKYYTLLSDDKMVTAAHAIESLGKIACAKPMVRNEITTRLIGVEKIQRNPECRNIHLGQVLLAFDTYYDEADKKDQKKMIELAKRQLKNSRPATGKKAEKFLKKHLTNS